MVGAAILGALGAAAGLGCAGTASPEGGGDGARDGAAPGPEGSAPQARDGGGCVPGAGRDFVVGPGQKYESLGAVPWETLRAGDTVRIQARPEPYREKIMVSGVGRADAPIRVCGLVGPSGELPVIDGEGATTRPSMEFPYEGHQPRGLVIIGKRHSAPYREQPEHIVIEHLEIRNAAPPRRFVDRAGKQTAWAGNAAGILLQRGSHVTIRGCVVHDNANGLFLGMMGAEELSRDILVEGNHIYGNGSPTDWYEHNVYNEASGVVFQYNRFGPPKSGEQGTLGANIKERSAGVVIRYNWIEDGAHLIDLVDSQEARDPNLEDPAFRESWIYGNVLVRGKQPSGSMVHYGGDSGLFDTYRKGTLHFYNNTVIIMNGAYPDWQTTALFELSTNEERLDMQSNVVFVEKAPKPESPVVLLGARDGVVSGVAVLSQNWISTGINALDGIPGKPLDIKAKVTGFDASLRGTDPGFSDVTKLELWPKTGSALIGKGTKPKSAHAVARQYLSHQRSEPRPAADPPSIGAFEAR